MFDIETIEGDFPNESLSGAASPPFRHLVLIGNALPRKCGLATFTSHVADAVRQRYPSMQLDHYAMDDGSGVSYPEDIHLIDAASSESFRDAAGEIERSGAEAIWLQHEYGIFGGVAGSHILELINATSLPLIVTLHTVLDRPGEAEEFVLRRLLSRAEEIVVMGGKGAEILESRYGVSKEDFRIIPHGVPDRPFRKPEELKSRFGWQGREVLMTFGLLAPDKGIRHMIEAMPAIVDAHPDTLYAVVGATHPNVARQEGEAHREMLQARALELGVADHVQFVDAFVEQEELLDMLQACDVYVTPYLNMNQVTSGTLSYAVAVGKPVIATPYFHAREILADDHGVIVPSGDPAALASAAIQLLTDDEQRCAIARAAYERGRTMLWSRVVEQALTSLAGRVVPAEPRQAVRRPADIPLDAVRRMSDPIGMLQHAVYCVPDRDHGYCIDDNARALMLMSRRGDDSQTRPLANAYAAFVQHGWNPAIGRFRNFMSFDRRWLEECGSDDSNGRTIWALGVTAARSDVRDLREWARLLFDEAAPHVAELDSARTRVFAALGAYALLDAHPGHSLALSLLRESGEQLIKLHEAASRDDWNWFEPGLTYDNARLPEALIRAGQTLNSPHMIEMGLSTLDWLVDRQTGPRGRFRPVGCHGFGRLYAPPLAFDQQPVEAVATIDAAAAAYEVTGDKRWSHVARHAFGWFFGDNDAGVPLADVTDGGCFDGLTATGVNRNQGAESILALHLAALTMREAFGTVKQTGQDGRLAAKTGSFALS